MPHYPKPYWRAQTQCYYVQLGKKQIRLPADRDDAYRVYHELLAKPRDAEPIIRPASGALVLEVLGEFLEWAAKNGTPRTYQWRAENLGTFAKSIPRTLLVSELRPFHVTREMNAHPTWGPDTRANFARCVQRAFRWAKDQGLIDANPIEKVEKPGRQRREDFYTREEYDRLLSLFPDQAFRDVLVTAWETGCRPTELFAVEAKDVDLAGKRWVFRITDSKGKRKSRVVYLSDAALEVTARLVKAHPRGKLFRNRDGRPWDKETVSRRFARKKRKGAVDRRYCLYSFRHSFAQRKLLEGVDPITVATLLGHSNLSMLANQYSHLMKDPGHLLRAVNPGRAAEDGSPSNGA